MQSDSNNFPNPGTLGPVKETGPPGNGFAALQKPQKVKFHLSSRFWDALCDA